MFILIGCGQSIEHQAITFYGFQSAIYEQKVCKFIQTLVGLTLKRKFSILNKNVSSCYSFAIDGGKNHVAVTLMLEFASHSTVTLEI